MSANTSPVLRPGRCCPIAYRYGAASLARPPDLTADTLYAVGGLYGNPFALRAVLELAARERGARLVFNGDFNWFDIDDAGFVTINEEVLSHLAIRGNVETELLSPDAAAGCGCGYPDYVSDADVGRSNAIMGMLAATAARHPALAARLTDLPMSLVAQVGEAQVGIVHGDADSLAGWGFAEEAINPAEVAAMFDAARVRVFASTHTCAAVAQVFETAAGPCALFNNGAAGMPNFAGATCGLVTRISVRPAPADVPALYGTTVAGLSVDAVALDYDHAAWVARFDRLWPADSPAALSYRRRIINGPAYAFAKAVRAGIRPARPATRKQAA
jgi:hypothetical protein